MKYLKTYELFGVWSEDLIELEDILRELEDDGIRVDINKFDGINIYLTNSREHRHGSFTAPDSFPFIQIKNNLDHLISYLKENGYYLDSIYNIVDLSPSKVEYKQLTDDTEIGRLELRFKMKGFNEGLFGFGSKKITDWKEQLQWIFDNYKSKKVSYLEAEVENDDRFNITFDSKVTGFVTFGFFGGNKDGEFRVDPTMAGEYDNWPVLSEDEYKSYRDKVQEVSDYLDENENKSDSSVGIGGFDLDIDESEINYMAAQEELKKLFKPYFEKEYQFEVEYYLWNSDSSNEKKVDDIKLTIYDIYGQARTGGKDGNPVFFLMVKCKVGTRKMQFMVDESNLAEYISIDEIPKDERYSKMVKINQDEDGLSRKEKRALKNHGYPYIMGYDGVPSDWAAIEFMKECKNIIKMFNDEVSKGL